MVDHTGGRGGRVAFAVVPAEAAVDVPRGIELEAASAVMHNGVTALALLESTGVADG